jgi:hypothetical protein
MLSWKGAANAFFCPASVFCGIDIAIWELVEEFTQGKREN